MAIRVGGRSALFAVAMSTALLVACASAGTPRTAPPPSSSSSAGPSPHQFRLDVLPASFVGQAIGGQHVVFLVSVTGSPADGPVRLTATAGAAAAVSIQPQSLTPGVVGEVTVVPNPVADGSEPVSLDVAITASRDGTDRSVERKLSVAPGTDGLATEAAAHLAPFAAWLATNRPELRIEPQTSWQATPGSWVLVVDHYAFFSKDWEVELSWHVMIPPDDWARIALRHRWSETKPSVAFEISSFSAGAEPHEIEPPEAVWR